jgi:uncharacterized protein YcgI (DUF1989 family)
MIKSACERRTQQQSLLQRLRPHATSQLHLRALMPLLGMAQNDIWTSLNIDLYHNVGVYTQRFIFLCLYSPQ